MGKGKDFKGYPLGDGVFADRPYEPEKAKDDDKPKPISYLSEKEIESKIKWASHEIKEWQEFILDLKEELKNRK